MRIQMNTVTLTGRLAGDSELRSIESGRELLNLGVYVDGAKRGESSCIRCAFFPVHGDRRQIRAG